MRPCAQIRVHDGNFLLRDSGALQSLVSKKCLAAGDYVDMLEYRLIQGILGQPTEVPLVEVRIESDKLSGTILCGLVETCHMESIS